MRVLCLICNLWLVEPHSDKGLVFYWCERCAQQNTPERLESQSKNAPKFQEVSLAPDTVEELNHTSHRGECRTHAEDSTFRNQLP